MIDLMAWNADATRMPYRMHSEYLRQLCSSTTISPKAASRSTGKPIALTDIRAPIFAVGTERDHVAPWRSVYKIHLLTDTEVTFVLTTGGHNAGIVSEPGHNGRSFQVMTKKPDDRYLDPEAYMAEAPRKEGSWWPEWVDWLKARAGAPIAPVGYGAIPPDYTALGDAPGTYILQEWVSARRGTPLLLVLRLGSSASGGPVNPPMWRRCVLMRVPARHPSLPG